MPEYVDHDVWEGLLLEEIKKTVLEVWREAGSPKKVFIAVDGVVPMAKIRQQRVRRFKSAWLRSSGSGTGQATWDSNSITPGTRFMEKLDAMLIGINKGWISEPSCYFHDGFDITEEEDKEMEEYGETCISVSRYYEDRLDKE
jgi:hypothetical protein